MFPWLSNCHIDPPSHQQSAIRLVSYVVDPSPSPQGAKVLCLTSLLKSHLSQLLIETMLAIEALQKLKDLTPLQHLPTALKYRSRISNNRKNTRTSMTTRPNQKASLPSTRRYTFIEIHRSITPFRLLKGQYSDNQIESSN